MNAAAPLRVGMIGVGGFGTYRRRKMRDTGLFTLVAAFDMDSNNLSTCVDEEGCLSVNSYDELLDVHGLEAVIISTGAKYHAEQALAAMDKGLHVFVEKPICSTASEVKALYEKQQATGVVVAVGHKDHIDSPRSVWLKNLIDNGGLGRVATFEAVTAHGGGFCIKPGDWRGDPERNPGGMLFQCGVHVFHELTYLFGPLRSITSSMNYQLHDTQTADITQCILQFESGLIGTLGAYHITPYRHSMTIYGTEKTLYLDDCSYGDPSIHALQTRSNGGPEPRVSLDIPPDDDAGGNLISFFRAIRFGENVHTSLIDGALPVLTCIAAVKSAREGKSVEIDFYALSNGII